MELWKHINNGYMVSNFGRIKSVDRVVKTPKGNRKYKGKLLTPVNQKTNRSKTKYQKVALGRRKSYWVHRLVANAFVENPDSLPQVDHINGNGLDNRAVNLRWVSQSQNIANKATLHKRLNVRLHNKKTHSEISRLLGDKNGHLVYKRLSKGWCISCATTVNKLSMGGNRKKKLCNH